MQPDSTRELDDRRTTAREIIYVVAAFSMLSIVLIGIISHWRPGSNLFLGPDTAFALWCLKWWPHSLIALHNPFDAPFFYPKGQNLGWTGAIPALALLMAPITHLTGPIFAYNALNVLALSINGILIYLVARELACRKPSAVICALLFYFSSYTWGQLLGHLNLAVTGFAVAAIYVTIRRIRKKTGRIRYVGIAGVLLALQFGTSNEIYATLIVFAALAYFLFILLSYKYLRQSNAIRIGCDMIAAILTSIALLLPYIYQIFTHHISGLQPISAYVADPLNYFIPTQTNLALGDTFKYLSKKFTGNITEQGVYLGLPVGILLIVANREFYKDRINRFLFVLLLLIIICSFGPRLTITGIPTIWLPWSIAEKLPLIKEALPVRFGLYVSLLSSILVGRLLTHTNAVHAKSLACASICMLLPNLATYQMSAVPREAFFANETYKQVIPAGAKVLVLPTYGFWGYQPALWQAEANFEFNIVNGLAGKPPAGFERYAWYYYGGAEPESARLGFLRFLEDTGTQFILSDDRAEDPLLYIYRDMHMPYEQYGQLRVAKVNRWNLERSLKMASAEQLQHLCESLAQLVKYGVQYVESGKDIASLSPSEISALEFKKDFGNPLPPDSAAKNWTTKGYWLGGWNGHLAVGFSSLDSTNAAALYQKFKDDILQVWFPYPRVFHDGASSAATGQFLMEMKDGDARSIQCGG